MDKKQKSRLDLCPEMIFARLGGLRKSNNNPIDNFFIRNLGS